MLLTIWKGEMLQGEMLKKIKTKTKTKTKTVKNERLTLKVELLRVTSGATIQLSMFNIERFQLTMTVPKLSPMESALVITTLPTPASMALKAFSIFGIMPPLIVPSAT